MGMKAKILIVEDERIVAKDIRNMLRDLGYQVPDIVTTGKEAVKAAKNETPDLVLMDIVINGNIDGIEAAQQIRKNFKIPVIFLTAYSDDATIERAKKAEPYGYILKPFDQRELKTTIEMALHKQEMEEKIEHLNAVLKAVRNVNQLITHEKDRKRLLKKACNCLIETRGYHSAWIILLGKSTKYLVTADPVNSTDYSALIEMWDRGDLPECVSKALSKPGIVKIKDVSKCKNCLFSKQYGINGAMIRRLESNGKNYGVLGVSVPNHLVREVEEMSLFSEVAGDIAFALRSIEVEEDRRRAEEKLAEREKYFHTLLSNLHEDVMVIDKDYRITYVNNTFIKTTGQSRHTIIGHYCYEILHGFHEPCDRQGELCPLKDVFKTGKPQNCQHIHYHKDGSNIWVDLLFSPLKDNQGNVVQVIETARDITKLKKTEEVLRESEEKFKTLFNEARDGIVITNSQTGFILDCNPYFENLVGRDIEQLRKMKIWEIRPSKLQEKAKKKFMEIKRKGVGSSAELNFQKPDGTVVPVEFVSKVVKIQNKNVIQTIVRNITERKQAEEKLRKSEDWFRSVFEGSRDAIFISDHNAQFVAVNEAAYHLTGYSKEQLKRMTIPELHDTDDIDAYNKFFNLIMSGEEITSEAKILKADGTKIDTEFSNKRIEINGVPYMHTVARDITGRKRLEDQFRQAQKMEAVGRLAGGVAHDFNNLLTVINGYSDFLLMEIKDDNKIRDDLLGIRSAGNRAANLTRQLLAFSRRQIFELRTIDLNMILQDLNKLLSRIIGEDIQLIMVPGENLGSIKADPGQIEQIIVNLVVNSRDAMPKGGALTIETANVELDEEYVKNRYPVKPGSYIMISVSDTGIGMIKEVQDKIFEPFFTTKEKGKGTGLGLATVYGIVKQSNGYIWVYSEPGKGTSFKIYLPRVDETPEKLSGSQKDETLLRGTETILVVEDEEGVRRMVGRTLKNYGYTVLSAKDYDSALQQIEIHAGTIHLLLTDVVLPEKNGRELSDMVKLLFPEMKVLFMSGYTDNSIVHHGVLGKGVKFLQKPFSPKKLAQKIREVLEKKE